MEVIIAWPVGTRCPEIRCCWGSTLDQNVGEVVADQGAVLIMDLDRMLLLDGEARLAQTMRQRVLVDFLQVSVPVVLMDVKRDLPHAVTQGLDVIVHGNLSCL
jgi:hypothetical protein